MIEHISWEQFLFALAAMAALYYTYVGLRYYRRELAGGFSKRTVKPKKKRSTVIQLSEEEFDRAFTELSKLTLDISAIVPRCRSSEQLLEELRQRLAHFKGRHVPAFQKTILNHTLQMARSNGISLSEEALSHTIENA
ncbi:hypothetical protein KZP23_04740 [Echinicola marina]|uniref:Uncharacterized protein n=1 Tax=Echinicola vietnamensis (strain DSM 17526 / LMG 23754 / KMM 6221) TaxID=926556 RepID=L0FYC2_ECHVK|nr:MULTISPECIES: hypothetical protein [Echinicola]AGA77635.1 hypothetical protein Echvi_1366 [Echinicola vietnamensis DSM 17526]UCS94340.1 hypothetical protein KZP23_04740 [Echinicola marina]